MKYPLVLKFSVQFTITICCSAIVQRKQAILTICTNKSAPALDFYRKNGFVDTFAEVDKDYAHAVSKGAASVLAPETEPWG